jgi:hypothetical protein
MTPRCLHSRDQCVPRCLGFGFSDPVAVRGVSVASLLGLQGPEQMSMGLVVAAPLGESSSVVAPLGRGEARESVIPDGARGSHHLRVTQNEQIDGIAVGSGDGHGAAWRVAGLEVQDFGRGSDGLGQDALVAPRV